MKTTGKRSAGNPHAPFKEAGIGNVAMAAGLRARAKALGYPPEPNVGAPILDPTADHRWSGRARPVRVSERPRGYGTNGRYRAGLAAAGASHCRHDRSATSEIRPPFILSIFAPRNLLIAAKLMIRSWLTAGYCFVRQLGRIDLHPPATDTPRSPVGQRPS